MDGVFLFKVRASSGLGVHAPIKRGGIFHHREIPHVHAHFDIDWHVETFSGLGFGHLDHGGAVWAKGSGEDHLHVADVVFDLDITNQSQLDDVHADLPL